MSARAYDGRHRGAVQQTPKAQIPRRRRLLSSVALPAAAAAVLTLTVTGAAASPPLQPHATALAQAGTLKATTLGATTLQSSSAASPVQSAKDKALILARTQQAGVARGTQRRELAAVALKAKNAQLAHSWQLPIKNPVRTSPFGYRWGRLHAGEDYAVSQGTKLGAMSTGTVEFAGVQGGYGNLVKILYWDGTVSYFGHMSKFSVTKGEHVDPGQIVGLSGNSGHSTGPHLHLEIHPGGGAAIDPLPWLAAHQVKS